MKLCHQTTALKALIVVCATVGCGDEGRQGPIDVGSLSADDFREAVEPFRNCTSSSDCTDMTLWPDNPCLCTLTVNRQYKSAVEELAMDVSCEVEEEFVSRECPYRNDGEYCNELGICVLTDRGWL